MPGGMTDLHQILGVLQPKVRPGTFVVVTVDDPADLPFHARIDEDEGVTLVLEQEVAEAHGLAYEETFGWITLTAHTSLIAVGITAAVANALTRVGISCNVLAGYYHDHLLIPSPSVAEAVEVLGGL